MDIPVDIPKNLLYAINRTPQAGGPGMYWIDWDLPTLLAVAITLIWEMFPAILQRGASKSCGSRR